MIKKLIGWLAALAIVALLVMTIRNRENYTSWCFAETTESETTEAAVTDSLTIAPADTLSTAGIDAPAPAEPAASAEPTDQQP